jgi:hypothetical protein
LASFVPKETGGDQSGGHQTVSPELCALEVRNGNDRDRNHLRL